jgi:type I restriction enzyme M protein
MLHHLEDNGTMAVVLPHGVLFRGSSEGVIRQYLIEKLNVLDAVIGLPANIFYGTSIPTSVLVFKKNRKHNKDVLFIDASKCFEKQGNQNALLPEHLEAILAAYKARQDSDKFAHVAPLDEISDNDYNLNIPRYVDVFEAEEDVNLEAIAEALQTLKEDNLKTDALIEGFCTELGITSPFSK